MFPSLGIQDKNYWLLRNVCDPIKRKAHLSNKALPENSDTVG